MACSNCGNDWCTGCTSKFAHVAGDPWDPADEHWKNLKPAPPPPPPDDAPGPDYDGTLPHCAGDPYDPADEVWGKTPSTWRPEPSPPQEPKPPPKLWDGVCPKCNGVVEITGYWTQQGMITSEFPLTDMIDLKCRECGHAWEIEE